MSKQKKAFITGITGMCGSHLAEILLKKGYKVSGLIRQSEVSTTERIDHLLKEDKIDLYHGDMLDFSSLYNAIKKADPDEIYNLAAQSHAGISFETVEYTLNVTGIAVGRILDIIRFLNPKIKLFQASTSEMLGGPLPWNEQSPFVGNNPYGCAKIMAHYLVENYRKAYGLFAVNGIMFNMESERRVENFVTRKITKAACEIKRGERKELLLGNLDAKRDWGYAPEYMEGAWLMLQQDKPKDYALATGEAHSVREWLEESFKAVGLNAYDYYKEDERFMRPSDIPEIRGDASLIEKELGWKPKKRFKDLIKIMIDADLKSG